MFVAHPFTYQTGALFPVPQTRSIGIVLGFAWGWMGRTNKTDGVLVIAPGYKSLWVWDLWGDFDHFKHALIPLSTEEAAHELEALQSPLDKELIEGPEDERRWSVGNGLTIRIHLSDNDKSVIRTFPSSTSLTTKE